NLESVPNLRHLGIRDRLTAETDAWRWLWKGPRAGLEALRLRVDEPRDLSAWIELLREDGARVELRLDLVQLLFVLDPDADYRTLRVTHNVPRWRSFAAEPMFDLLVRTLAPTLSVGEVDRVEVDPRVCDVARLEATLRERAREVESWIIVSAIADPTEFVGGLKRSLAIQ